MDLAENNITDDKDEVRDPKFSKGQSKRIWNELYKVIDSSDVVIQVLDARDPLGTRSKHIEEFMAREKKHKHLIFILNKCDLVPTWVTKRWVASLSAEYPTLAFHASVTNPFGKGALIQLLRQFGKLHKDKKNISVGFIGYPNVGKSSIINTLKKKKVCKTAPIPGETKVWQYVTLMRKIYLIDCPGVVYPSADSETDIVLKGVVRVENLQEPAEHIGEVLKRVKKEYITKTYKVSNWDDTEDFLDKFCKKSGRLLKGGEPDVNTVAKMILADYQRGRLPYFVPPPKLESSENDTTEKSTKNIEFVPAQDNETQNETKNIESTDNILSVKQSFKSLTVAPEFITEDASNENDVDISNDDISDGCVSDNESDDDDEPISDDGEGPKCEGDIDEAQKPQSDGKFDYKNTEIVDDEISFQYFDHARKKFKSKLNIKSHDIDNFEEQNDDEDEEIENESDDEHIVDNESYCSEDEVEAELIKSLTPEERKFLGFDETTAQENISNKMKFKMISSPSALCVEAVSDSENEKYMKTKPKKLKRKIEEVLDSDVEGEEHTRKHEKPKRMTTNKGKTGSRYYENTNVKNKNKNKKNKDVYEPPRPKKKKTKSKSRQ